MRGSSPGSKPVIVAGTFSDVTTEWPPRGVAALLSMSLHYSTMTTVVAVISPSPGRLAPSAADTEDVALRFKRRWQLQWRCGGALCLNSFTLARPPVCARDCGEMRGSERNSCDKLLLSVRIYHPVQRYKRLLTAFPIPSPPYCP